MNRPDDRTTCGKVRELLPEFLAGRLPAEDDRLVRAHIDVCAECRDRANAVSLLQQTPIPAPDPGRWDHFVEGVVDAAARRRGLRRRAVVLGTALAVAALLLFAWLRSAGTGPAHEGLDALARRVADLPDVEAAAWTVGLSPGGFMPAGFDTSGLSDEQLQELAREVGRT